MSAGRRGLLLAAAFLGSALWLCPGPRAHAQPQFPMPPRPVDPGAGRHNIWNHGLSADQIRQLLAQFGKGDGEAGKQLEDLIRDRVMRENPKLDKDRLDSTIKQMMADEEFMNRMKDLAQQYKNENPNRKVELTPEALEKLKNLRPGDGKGSPFRVPKELPPFDPNNFDPKQFPHLDPLDPPKTDPDTGRLVNPKDGQALDPRTGQPAGPNVKQKDGPPGTGPGFDPARPPGTRPKFDPTAPPRPGDPPQMNPGPPQSKMEPNPPAQPPKFDPDNPFGAPKESPEKAAKTKAVETATALWEKNVGPIEESPAVKRAIFDLVSDQEAMDALTDGKGNSIFDALRDTGNGGEGLNDFFGGADGKGWDLPKLDLKLDWGGRTPNVDVPDGGSSNRRRWPDLSSSSSRPGSSGGSSGGMGSFDLGGMKVPWLFALLLLAAVVAAVLWWKWQALFPAGSPEAALAGVGAWPGDPREINTRDDIVKAFEYLSVLLCGPGAKTWTHSTIADELSALAATHGDTAVKLARLYELARYAPLDEPLTRAEILEARRLACDLAGVDE